MIKAPGWCPNAIPTLKGWKHHVRPEILKPAKLTQEQIDEYNGVQVLVEAEPAPIAPTATMLTSNDNIYVDIDDDLADMSKTELEQVGREHGIELDRRKSKKTCEKMGESHRQ